MKQLKTQIYSLSFGGNGIGKVDGKVAFVEGALPGEEVAFDVVKDTPRYMEGKAVQVITSSPDREEPLCRYYSRCGGCQLQHIKYEKELFYKKEQVLDLIGRIAGCKDFVCEEMTASPSPYHYRDSVTLHKSARGYGFFAKDGRTVIDIKECPISSEAINKEIAEITGPLDKDEVTLKSDYSGRVWSSVREGERFFLDRYLGVDFYLSPKAFSQPNRFVAEKIVLKLNEWIDPAGNDTSVFFDAYSGAGFFSFLLKQKFSACIGMDEVGVAIDSAKTTAKTKNIQGVKFYKGDVETEFLDLYKRMRKDKNVIFLDPPRGGASKGLLEGIVEAAGPLDKIFYLSCDPARLARDIKIITASGKWKLRRIAPFDMFPRTKHIETLAEFFPSNSK